MGICCSVYALTPDQLSQLRADPPLVWRLLEPDDEDCYLAEVAAARRVPWLQRLLGRGRPRAPAPAPALIPELVTQGPPVLELDKSWDGLRHCIGLCAPDAPDFFAGDGALGEFEVGYGPALAVDGHTLARYAKALVSLDEARLVQQLQSSDFKDVYLGELWRRRDADAHAYLLDNFRDLLGFTREAAALGLAAVLRYS